MYADPSEPSHIAAIAGLRVVRDDGPGICRRKRGRGFSYEDPDGRILRGADRRRCESLAIPPAWQGVWISPDDRGHLQATGRDARRRQQYRYHSDWSRTVSTVKFDRLKSFGDTLPRIRRRVRAALKPDGLTLDSVIAACVRLLDRGQLRIGNAGYTRRNGTFGATTLRPRHVCVDGAHVELDFRGKHGVQRSVDFDDRLLSPVLTRLAGSGRRLFAFEDSDGVRHRVTSANVNDWLRKGTDEYFTAKDFRTWHGSVDVLDCLLSDDAERPTKRRLSEAIRHAASELGNRPATCRAAERERS